MFLYELKVGQTARIERIDLDDLKKERLVNLGVYEGVKIKSVRISPFSDPVLYEVSGYKVAISKKTAKTIKIREINE